MAQKSTNRSEHNQSLKTKARIFVSFSTPAELREIVKQLDKSFTYLQKTDPEKANRLRLVLDYIRLYKPKRASLSSLSNAEKGKLDEAAREIVTRNMGSEVAEYIAYLQRLHRTIREGDLKFPVVIAETRKQMALRNPEPETRIKMRNRRALEFYLSRLQRHDAEHHTSPMGNDSRATFNANIALLTFNTFVEPALFTQNSEARFGVRLRVDDPETAPGVPQNLPFSTDRNI